MKENGTSETDVEEFILSKMNIRPDHRISELVEAGIISKEVAMEYLAGIPKIIESPDSMKIFYFYTFSSQLGDEFNYSYELLKKYPDQIRMDNIDDTDIFAFVCSKRKDEYWIHQDVKQLLDYSKSKNKVLLPIISDFSLGYEIITITDFNTDLPFKIFEIDDREPELEQEPEIVKFGEDIEMGAYSSIPFKLYEGMYLCCTGKKIISGKMDENRIYLKARVCSILECSDDLCSYATKNYYDEYSIFQVWASSEKKYHVVVIVKKIDILNRNCTIRKGKVPFVPDWALGRTDLPDPSEIDENDKGVIETNQIVNIYGIVSLQPMEGCKIGFIFGKDPILKLPVIFADRVDICKFIETEEEIEETGETESILTI